MRLASKMFLAASLVLVVLIGIAAWSVRAVSEFVAVQQKMVTRSVPALRLETSLRESMLALVRLETRHAVLHDPTYRLLWSERADQAGRAFEELEPHLATTEEFRHYRKSRVAFATYHRLASAAAEAEPATTKRPAATPPAETRQAAARANVALGRLTDATYDGLQRLEAEARRLEQRMWNAVFTGLPLGVLAGLAGAGLLAYGMTRSLRRLAEGASRVAEGRFSVPVEVRSTDEIGELATAFNRMAEQLAKVDRMKEEFFAHISHELRTPLTAVREATNLLRDEIPGPLSPKQSRLVEIVRTSSERVLGLVNQILELSRLEAGLLAFDRRTVDLDGVLTRAIDELRPQAEAQGVALERNGSAPAGTVVGDDQRLIQVVVNLVANAIKYTSAGGVVRVQTEDRGADVEVIVEDTGAGIPPEILPRVFDRYCQGTGARGGSGLGLAIVKSIVQAHGGRVSAESTEGVGSRFHVVLPRRGAAL